MDMGLLDLLHGALVRGRQGAGTSLARLPEHCDASGSWLRWTKSAPLAVP